MFVLPEPKVMAFWIVPRKLENFNHFNAKMQRTEIFMRSI